MIRVGGGGIVYNMQNFYPIPSKHFKSSGSQAVIQMKNNTIIKAWYQANSETYSMSNTHISFYQEQYQ